MIHTCLVSTRLSSLKACLVFVLIQTSSWLIAENWFVYVCVCVCVLQLPPQHGMEAGSGAGPRPAAGLGPVGPAAQRPVAVPALVKPQVVKSEVEIEVVNPAAIEEAAAAVKAQPQALMGGRPMPSLPSLPSPTSLPPLPSPPSPGPSQPAAGPTGPGGGLTGQSGPWSSAKVYGLGSKDPVLATSQTGGQTGGQKDPHNFGLGRVQEDDTSPGPRRGPLGGQDETSVGSGKDETAGGEGHSKAIGDDKPAQSLASNPAKDQTMPSAGPSRAGPGLAGPDLRAAIKERAARIQRSLAAAGSLPDLGPAPALPTHTSAPPPSLPTLDESEREAERLRESEEMRRAAVEKMRQRAAMEKKRLCATSKGGGQDRAQAGPGPAAEDLDDDDDFDLFGPS